MKWILKHQNWTRIALRNEQSVIEPQKHVKHDNFENFTKSLILESRHSFSFNFTIFEKYNSNCLMLQPSKLYILEHVPYFCPGKNVFFLTLHTLRQSLDWPLISILTSQPMHETHSSPQKKFTISQLTRKL